MTTTEQAEPTPEGTEPTDQAPPAPEDATDDTAKDGKAGAEAAKYRTRLRAAEAERDGIASERDQLRERLNNRLRADAEQAAAEAGFRDGADLWLAGDIALEDLLDDDGQVDPAKVRTHTDQALASRPHWRRQGVRFDGGKRPGTVGGPTWSNVLRGK